MPRLIGVNTLVFNEEIQAGQKEQFGYFNDLKEMGAAFVEVRREFFHNLDEELATTKEHAEKLEVKLFYSVPSSLFISGELNLNLEDFFKEAKQMNAEQIKLTIGDFDSFTNQIQAQLKALLEKYPTVKLSLENDQSVAGGSAEILSNFVISAHELDLPLGVTFDTGNFVYIGEPPEEAAHILKDIVTYIHIKNVRLTDEGELDFAMFETGDFDLSAVLNVFNPSVPAAIEYPCGNKETAMAVLEKELEVIKK